ncbi:MAG: pseudouridine synthase [Rudaea sp.]|nr:MULTISPECIES: pseudouridine synthase [unclassified Rudaea]MBN8884541.1 pseudouridine synthase [Rudaea sp.]MBR0346106.1 pseudouridine synthase [Rudaea sp.]
MLVALNKPFNVLCQFTDRSVPPRRTLADFVGLPDVYPAGRLDYDSEGLLLTDDGRLAQRLTDPRFKVEKTYLVQVEGEPTDAQLAQLRKSVLLNDGPTLPAQATLLDGAPQWLWPRDPPVRFRKSVPDAYVELTIREGRNRQVRRMTAAVGLPTLRLIRVRIGHIALDDLKPGQIRNIEEGGPEWPLPEPRDPGRAKRKGRASK